METTIGRKTEMSLTPLACLKRKKEIALVPFGEIFWRTAA